MSNEKKPFLEGLRRLPYYRYVVALVLVGNLAIACINPDEGQIAFEKEQAIRRAKGTPTVVSAEKIPDHLLEDYLDPKKIIELEKSESPSSVVMPKSLNSDQGEVISPAYPDFIDSQASFGEVPPTEIESAQRSLLEGIHKVLKIPLDGDIINNGGTYFSAVNAEGQEILAIELPASEDGVEFQSPVRGEVLAVYRGEANPNFEPMTIIMIEYPGGQLEIRFLGDSLVQSGDEVTLGQVICQARPRSQEADHFDPMRAVDQQDRRADITFQNYGLETDKEGQNRYVPKGMSTENILRLLGEIEDENGEMLYVILYSEGSDNIIN